MVSQYPAVVDDGEHGERSGSVLGVLMSLEFDYIGFQFISVIGCFSYIVSKLD